MTNQTISVTRKKHRVHVVRIAGFNFVCVVVNADTQDFTRVRFRRV